MHTVTASTIGYHHRSRTPRQAMETILEGLEPIARKPELRRQPDRRMAGCAHLRRDVSCRHRRTRVSAGQYEMLTMAVRATGSGADSTLQRLPMNALMIDLADIGVTVRAGRHNVRFGNG